MKKRTFFIGCAAMLVYLAGCESQPRMWVKDGVPPQQSEADRSECEQEWMTRFATGTVNTTQDVAGCMARKGYRDATPDEYRKAADSHPQVPK